jgi:hypothetical protein
MFSPSTFVPVRKKEDYDFIYLKYETNESKENTAPEEIEQEDEEEQSSNLSDSEELLHKQILLMYLNG